MKKTDDPRTKNKRVQDFIKALEANPTAFFRMIGIEKFKITGPTQATGCCPFHIDKNPSFSMNTQNGTWKCHANVKCGSGNIRSMLNRIDEMVVQKIEFKI